VWGANPVALHVSNLVLHAVASVLMWRLRITIGGDGSIAGLLALAFFVVEPVHKEAAAWIPRVGTCW
jgi:hypothetical protein